MYRTTFSIFSYLLTAFFSVTFTLAYLYVTMFTNFLKSLVQFYGFIIAYTGNYIQRQLTYARATSELFTEKAVDQIYEYISGIARMIDKVFLFFKFIRQNNFCCGFYACYMKHYFRKFIRLSKHTLDCITGSCNISRERMSCSARNQ